MRPRFAAAGRSATALVAALVAALAACVLLAACGGEGSGAAADASGGTDGAGVSDGSPAPDAPAPADLAGDGAADGAAPARVGLRLVTLNLLHGVRDEDPAAQPYDRLPERLPRIAAALAALAPDVVLLQEVARFRVAAYPDVPATVRAALTEARPEPGWRLFFGDVIGGAASEYEPGDEAGNGLGQLTATRLPLARAPQNRLVSPLRSVLLTTVEAGPGIGRVAVFDVHLEGEDGLDGEDGPAAAAELQAVLAFVTESAATADLVVLAGDFNRTPDAPSLALLRDAGFVDPVALAGPACDAGDRRGCTANTLPLAEPGFRATERIDQVWLRRQADPTARPGAPSGSAGGLGDLTVTCAPFLDEPFAVPGGVLWASDHIGVQCDVWTGAPP